MSQIPDSFGPYQVLAKLGEGGMGEVYRAKDTRLDRLVALKVSKTAFDERFEREARAVAALNHPHICALHDVGPNYLVMELVDGVPLAGPLPIEKAVEYAGQILDALDAAHKKGITHRDLKPANILVTKHGIKLLDFGLAKQTNGPLGDAQATMSALTSQGQIVGTLQYMAPEQLQGQPTDARADLFAFGCVLYELLSGKRAFDGSSPASVIAAILERQPAPLSMHPPLDRVIATCLAKNPDDRFQTALDTKRAMQWAMEQPTPGAMSTVPSSRRRERALIAVAVASIAVALGVVGWPSPQSSATIALPRLQVAIEKPADQEWRDPVLSPDGTRVAFRSTGGIFVRSLDAVEGQLINLPPPAGGVAWSPDGQSLVFCSASNELQTITAGGGSLRTLGATCGPFVRGSSWASDGTILFSRQGPVERIRDTGGAVTAVTKDPGTYPTMLPDGRHFLFLRSEAVDGKLSYSIHLGSTTAADIRKITVANSKAEYTSGHLVFMRGTTLMAQPFDLLRLETAAEDAFPVASDVGIFPAGRTAQFTVAANGLLVYRTGGTGRTALTWVDRTGKELSVIDDSVLHSDVSLSADGRTLADTRVSPKTLASELWLTDLARGVSSRLTPEGEFTSVPSLTTDGARVVYMSTAGIVYVRDTGGSGAPLQLATLGDFPSWSPDRTTIIMTDRNGGAGAGISAVSVAGDHRKVSYSELTGVQPAVSPDGKWVAYAADESGQYNVFVQSLPPGRGKWKISTAGGAQPIWRPDGRELFYRGEGGVMAVPIASGGEFSPGSPTLLFKFATFGIESVRRQFAVSPDGQRFLIIRLMPDRGRTILLQNWLPQNGGGAPGTK